jgi:hypothetical protein
MLQLSPRLWPSIESPKAVRSHVTVTLFGSTCKDKGYVPKNDYIQSNVQESHKSPRTQLKKRRL